MLLAQRLLERWLRAFSDHLPVAIWLALGAMVAGTVLAAAIQLLRLISPAIFDGTPLAADALLPAMPRATIAAFAVLMLALGIICLLAPSMRLLAFRLASALLAVPNVRPARGLKAALFGAVWSLHHLLLGSVACLLMVFALPIGFGALVQALGLEQALTIARLQLSYPLTVALALCFLALLAALPFLIGALGHWLRLLARHLMLGQAGEFKPLQRSALQLQLMPDAPDAAGQTSLSVPLSARERDILLLLAEGLTNKAIAERLFITTETVKSHVSSILIKLNADNRTQAVVVAMRIGLLRIEDPDDRD